MIIGELAQFNELGTICTNYAPFTYQIIPAIYTCADYWQTAFGCPDESIIINLFISAFVRQATIFYSTMISLLDCIDHEMSLFWDQTLNRLYFHFEHDQCWWTDYYEYNTQKGFTNKDIIYIDNVKYSPLIKSILSIAQQQDLVNYDKLSMMTGNIELENMEGILDELIEKKVFGNDFRLYHLNDISGQQNYTRSDLLALAFLFIDDYDTSLLNIIARLQDKRMMQDIKIPTEVFTLADYPDIAEEYINKAIPLQYGLIKCSEAFPVDGDAGIGNDVTFRQGLLLTSLGTVQVLINDMWTIKVPISTDLLIGEFMLAEADGRQANGTPYKCRVLGSEAIQNTYASDCIKDINDRFLDVPYIESSYNRTEWEIEEIKLNTIGISFEEKIELFDAIRLIQAGANIGFRYEIMPDGRRTIRIDDWERIPIVNHIPKERIQNNNILPIATDRKLLAAETIVKYAYNYEGKYYQEVKNDDYYAEVRRNYRQTPSMEIITALTTQEHAEARALWNAERFREIPKIIELELRGKEFYTLRIYDIIDNVEITPGNVNIDTGIIIGREYYGIWKIQILGIDPDFKKQNNTITARLIEKKF